MCEYISGTHILHFWSRTTHQAEIYISRDLLKISSVTRTQPRSLQITARSHHDYGSIPILNVRVHVL